MCFGAAFLVGTYLLWVSICKPSFFWDSSQVRSLRYRWGERQAQAFYGGIGALLLGILCFTYGLVYMSVQLLHIGIFAVAVLGGIQLYRWSRQSRPSSRERELNRQRQKLSQLIRR